MKAKAQLELFDRDVNKELAQHNYLITARFNMGVLETRIFISMLARIHRTDTEFSSMFIPISEVIAHLNGSNYKQLKKACENLTGFKINALLTEKRSFDFIALIERVTFIEGASYIEAKFTQSAKPYLLQLAGNFTTAQLEQLIRLRNPLSIRMYWLFKHMINSNKFEIEINELKSILFGKNDINKYEDFKDFKKRVLIPIRDELKGSDAPFEISFVKNGRSYTHLIFKPLLSEDNNSKLSEELSGELLALGVNLRIIGKINQMIASDKMDEGYIRYVVNRKKLESKTGKIKKLAGAIADSIVNKYLYDEYCKPVSPTLRNIQKTIFNASTDVTDTKKIITIQKATEMFKEDKESGKTRAVRLEAYLKALSANGWVIK